MKTKLPLKKILSYIIPPVITVGLCRVLYADLDLGALLNGARQCSPLPVVLFLLANVAAMICRGLRWRLQLRAAGVNPGLGVMSRSIFGTYAVNLVFPRLGEFWRCAYISRTAGAEFSSVFGTMVADRLADTLMVGLISLTALSLSAGAMSRFIGAAAPAGGLPGATILWGGVALIAAAAIYLTLANDPFSRRIRQFLLKTWRGFILIFSMPRKGLWLLLTLGIWGGYIASMALSMAAFPPTAHLGPGAVMLTFVFGSLAMAIPSNGGIGPWQYAVILALSGLYDIPQPVALVFATLNLGANTLLNILLGLYTFLHLLLRSR
ncbi:MAG: flippase-like domain-containing protein [Bacteroides sp.]|nr:flippase-like domain-containing protein [Bacteroides sp.]